jgi:DNA-binding transcriptional MocR family regulator
MDHRMRLVELAHRNQIYLIADEVYHLLGWESDAVDDTGDSQTRRRPARATMCISPPSPYVISVSSFTKIFSPGLRCGWVETFSPTVLRGLENIGYIQSQGGVAPFVSEVMRLSLESGAVAENIAHLSAEYKERATAVVLALQSLEPVLSIPFVPTGGYFLWVNFKFPADRNATGADFVDFLAALPECNTSGSGPVLLLKGKICTLHGVSSKVQNDSWLVNSARICFACLSKDDLMSGVSRIKSGLDKFLKIKP